jgi:hypothetical protein
MRAVCMCARSGATTSQQCKHAVLGQAVCVCVRSTWGGWMEVGLFRGWVRAANVHVRATLLSPAWLGWGVSDPPAGLLRASARSGPLHSPALGGTEPLRRRFSHGHTQTPRTRSTRPFWLAESLARVSRPVLAVVVASWAPTRCAAPSAPTAAARLARPVVQCRPRGPPVCQQRRCYGLIRRPAGLLACRRSNRRAALIWWRGVLTAPRPPPWRCRCCPPCAPPTTTTTVR